MINTRNATDVTVIENSEPLSQDEILREFSTGEISKLAQDRMFDELEEKLQERKNLLEAKKALIS